MVVFILGVPRLVIEATVLAAIGIKLEDGGVLQLPVCGRYVGAMNSIVVMVHCL